MVVQAPITRCRVKTVSWPHADAASKVKSPGVV